MAVTHPTQAHRRPCVSPIQPAAPALPIFKSAVDGVRTGRGRARWAVIGDSLTAGYGSNGHPGGTEPGVAPNFVRRRSWPSLLSDLFTTHGIRSRADAVWTSNNPAARSVGAYTESNSEVVFTGSGWELIGAGNSYFTTRSSKQGTLTFRPEFAADRLDVYYAVSPGNGGFTVADDTGLLARVDTGGTTSSFGNTVVKRTAASTEAFRIEPTATGVRNASGPIYVFGLVPFDTTTPRLEIWNMGIAGSRASDWTRNVDGYDLRPAIKTISADLWSVQLGANDAAWAVPPSTFLSNLENLLEACGTGGAADKLIVASHPADPSPSPFDLPDEYRGGFAKLASASRLMPPIDFSCAGLTAADYFDTIHLTASGYEKEAVFAHGIITTQL